MENNNLRNPSVPYAVNGGTPSPAPASPAPTPLFADVARSAPPAPSNTPVPPPVMPAVTPIQVQAPVPANPIPAATPPAAPPPGAAPPPKPPKKPRDLRKIALRTGVIALLLLLAGGGILVYDRLRNTPAEQNAGVNSAIASTSIPLSEFANSGSLALLGTQSLTVNGQLRANESFVLAPQNQPGTGERGQLYYDNASNQLAYYNGIQFIKLPGNNFVQTFQGLSGAVTLTGGNGITVNGTTLTNSGVTSLGGQTGDVTVGSGLSVVGNSLQATGVQSLSTTSATLSITNDGAGNLTIESSGAGTGTVTSGGGTNGRIALFTGAQNIEDSALSQTGTTVTVNGDLSITGNIGLSAPLSVANGGTGANTLAANGVIVGNGTSPVSSVAAGSAGLCLISTVGAPTWQACPGGGGGVTSFNGLTGALSLANATAAGSTITINDASTAQKGIAQFNSTNFSAAGGTINTIQDIAITAAPTFGRLTVSSSQASNGMFLVNNTNGSGSGNLIDLQLAGVSKLAVSPAGAMTLTGTINGQTISSSANFTGSLTVAGAASLNGGATVSGTLTANTITPSGALTVGATAQSFTVQGNASSTITATNGASTTTVSFQTPTANVNYRLLTAAAGTYDICTTVGNCTGVGGGVTTPGGTTNKVAKFTGSQTLGDSIITDNGSTVTIGGTLAVNTITPGAAMTIGATSQTMTLQGSTTQVTATSGGITNTLTFATPATTNKTITIPNANGTVAVSATGPLAIDANGNITCATCTTTSTAVTSLNSLTGALTIANATTGGSTITINDASTSQKGIAQFNSTNFSAASGVINTIQDIAVSAAPTFGRLTVTSSQASNGMLLVNNTNAGASGNLLDLQLSGVSKLAVSPAGAMTLTGTLNGQTISSSASFTGSLAVTGAASLNGGASVTGTLTANTITPAGALTVGATTQSFTVQGNASSTITATNGANTTTLSFQTPTASVNYRLLTAAAGTYDICTTVGNCAGVGGGVTTAGGTTNTLAKFTGSNAIGNSIITDNGTTVTIGGTLAVNTITPGAAMTIGATSQNLTLQGATTKLTATSGGVTNTLQFATPATGNKTITIPNATGTVAVSASGPLAVDAAGNISCPTCVTSGGGGGGVGAVDSLDGLTGALTIANSSGSGNTVTINDASTSQKGIAQFNSTNFSASGGIVNTIQDIAVSSAPTFGRLTVTSSQASNPMLLVNNTNAGASGNLLDVQLNGSSKLAVTPAGAMTLVGALNGQTISSAASFTGSLAVAGAANLNGGASVTGTLTANTITPTGALTVGATSQSFLVQGSAASTITATNGANTTTVAFQTPTAAVTYRFLTAAAGTYDVCTTVGNCAGVGGSVTTAGGTTNKLAKFTGSNAIGDSIITDNGSTVTIGGTLAVNTLTPTTALTVGATGQNLTLQGATTNLTSTSGGVTNTLTFATPATTNKTITIPNASGTLVVSASGPLAIDAAGNITCATCTTTSTAVTSLDGLTGALTLANSSGSAGTVTIDNASTSAKGIAQFNNTNFSAASGVINTIQDIAVSSAPTFGRLTVTSSQASNGMLLVNNTNGAGSGNLIDLQLAGSSKLAVTPAGNMTLVGTLNGQTISSSASFTGSLAVTGAANLNGGASVTGTLAANTITPTGALTIGATNQSFLVQGSSTSTITATSGANTTTLAFQTPTAAVTYRFLTAAAGTYDICTTVGNCAGVGGSVTTAGGTTNKLAKFTGSNAIGDSIITDNGSTVTIGGTLAVNTLTPTAALTVGATGQNLTLQGAVTNLTSTSGGVTNTLTFATPSGGAKTITVPNASGTLVVSASGPLAIDSAGNITCATCTTTSSAVTSLDGLTGALTLANSSGSAGTITIDDASTSAKGIAQFNSTNFSAASGVINTVQNINTSAAPTFGQLTITSSQAVAKMLTINNTNVGAAGNLMDLQLNGSSKFSVSPAGAVSTGSTINGQTISSTANFTGTLGVTGLATLTGGATLSASLQGTTAVFGSANAVTLGTTGSATGAVLFKGATAASGTLTLIGPGNPSTNTITLPNETGTVCTTGSVCTGYAPSTGSGSYIQNGTAQQTANFNIVSTAAGNIAAVVQGAANATQPVLVVKGGATPSTGGDLLQFQDSTSAVLGKVDASGNLSLGVATPDTTAKLDLGGSSARYFTTGNNFRDYHDVLGYSVEAPTTGTMKIVLPKGLSSTMLNITIKGVNAATAASGWELVLGGYNYTTGWTYANASLQGKAPFDQVRFGFDGTNAVILLGTTSTAWSYPKINVTDVVASYSNTTGWGSGWSASVVTSETGISGIVAATLPIYVNSSNNVGIGTVNPSALLSVGSTSQFQVNSSGAVTAVGVNSGTGLLQGAGGLTVSGGVVSLNASSNFATNINTGTSTGAVTIGGGSSPFSIDSTAFDVSTAGALSGITTIATSGAINGQTISSTANFTGTVAIQGSSALTLGTTGSATGSISFKGATAASGTINLVGQANPTGTRTITLPDASGTVCLDNGNCSGTNGYILNQTGSDQTANFQITGTGRANTSLLTPLIDTPTSAILNVGTTNATTINLNQNTTLAAAKTLTVTSALTTLSGATSGDALSVSNSTSTGNIAVFKDNATAVLTIGDGGATTLQTETNQLNALKILTTAASGAHVVFNADTLNERVGIGGVATASKFEVQGGDGAIYWSGNNPRLILGDSTAGGQNGYLQWDSANDYFRIETVGTNGLKIKDNFVAIGNIFPDQPLKIGNGSTLLGQVDTTGQTQFKTSTNSTAAFKVLNASDVSQFTVDSSNSRVYIGNPTGDTTGALLVLDTKTGSGDPTGVFGAMYYNQANQEFRCFRSTQDDSTGEWSSCASNPIDRGFEINEEFLGGGNDNTLQSSIGELGWTNNNSGGTSFYYNTGMPISGNHPGNIEIQTPGGAINRGTTLTLNGDSDNSVIVAAGNDVKMAVGFDSAMDNMVFRGGLHSQLATITQPVSGVWWELPSNVSGTPVWNYCYGNGTAATCASSGITATATTWYTLEIKVTATGSGTSAATFYIRNTSGTPHNSSFSVSSVTIDTTNPVNPALACWASVASDRYCEIDYYQFRGTASGLRN